MRILVTVHGFLTPSMTFVYNQIKAFKSEGHTIKIVACEIINEHLFPCDDVVRVQPKKSPSFYLSKLKRGLGLDFTLHDSHFVQKFESEVKAFQPDIIHAQFGLQLIRIFPAVRGLGIPVITTFHGYDASKYLRNKLYVRKLKRILRLKKMYATTVSVDMKDRLAAHGLDVSRTFVDYLGVDTNFFNPKGEGQERAQIVFLQVANFVEKKGHEYTIKAFAKHLRKTKAKNERLVLAGQGPLFETIKTLSEVEGISEYVMFPGLVNRNQVKSLMEEADYFVHHSVTSKDGDMEGLPTVIMEAMAMRLPILSTYHAGIPELVNIPDSGILVNEKDIEAYAKAFSEIKNCTAESSRTRINSNFNLDDNTKKILEIFKSITNEC